MRYYCAAQSVIRQAAVTLGGSEDRRVFSQSPKLRASRKRKQSTIRIYDLGIRKNISQIAICL